MKSLYENLSKKKGEFFVAIGVVFIVLGLAMNLGSLMMETNLTVLDLFNLKVIGLTAILIGVFIMLFVVLVSIEFMLSNVGITPLTKAGHHHHIHANHSKKDQIKHVNSKRKKNRKKNKSKKKKRK